MNILDLTDWCVRDVRRSHPALVGKKPFARGSRAALFEGSTPERVFKLTVDQPSYLYLTDGTAPTGVHVPIVFEDHGEIGTTSRDEPMYLVETERLYRRPRGYALSRVLRQAYEMAEEEYRNNDYRFPPSLPDLDDQPEWLPIGLARFFAELNVFVSNTESRLDLCWRSNYMVRANGELVASDPVFDSAAGARKCSPARGMAPLPPHILAQAQQGQLERAEHRAF